MRTLTLSLFAALCLSTTAALADPRPPEPLDAAGIRIALQKLNVTGSALYVAAHPDDENTSVIALLSKGRMVRTGYLSMTRGDGGQNLIGADVGEKLGVIRTQELLAARRIDGGEQFFTRALDFGFSKSSNETLEKWNRERILSDVVWVIRNFQPDVILTRFLPDSGGHGHHLASATLAEEAFTAAADPKRFPDQLARGVAPWQAKRLEWNVFRFGPSGPDTTPGRLKLDLGEYSELLGRSFSELAGESRSMHKTQGFGAPERRGAFLNTFQHRLGEPARTDLFDGVDLTWSRVPGGAKLTPLFARALKEFNAEHPDKTVPVLLEALDAMRGLPDSPIVRRKRDELLQVIRACSGLWLDALATQHTVSPGSRLRIVTSALSRADLDVRVSAIDVGPTGSAAAARVTRQPNWTLPRNETRADTLQLEVPATQPTIGPYWLQRPALAGSFDVEDSSLIGRPENPPAFEARFRVTVGGHEAEFTVPIVYRWTDPVQGERYRDVVVVRPATLRFDRGAYLFADARAREVRVNVQSADRPVSGTLTLRLPAGWSAKPAAVPVALNGGEADTTVSFTVTPGATPAASVVSAELVTDQGIACHRQLVRLDYAHIPIQTLLPRAEAHLVRADVKIAGASVGYVMGSGDQVPDALEQMGYKVTLLTDDDLERRDLAPFDAIVIGVRAYNTRPRLKALAPRLLGYVERGGRLVTQYQTADLALDNRIAPYPLKISRDRVTVEEAEMRLAPGSPVLAAPNPIGAADFTGWVQERGLYYAGPYDAKYQSAISANDPGETPKEGGLVFATYGKGAYVYTGLAFFRQLPAGVPGAYRLFANLVSPPAGAPPRQ